MFLRSIIFTLLLAASSALASAQTCVIAQPMSDEGGMVVYQVTKILKIEGTWKQAPFVGQVLFPAKRTRAFPLDRFGEAVLIELPEIDNYSSWHGVHVHKGCIPALSGIPVDAIVKEIVKKPSDPVGAGVGAGTSTETKAMAANSDAPAHPSASHPGEHQTSDTDPASPTPPANTAPDAKWNRGECPICHQVHIRI